MKFRVTGNFTSENSARNYKGLWVVPSLSERSLLFGTRTWRKAVIYAMLRTDGIGHKEAVRLALGSSAEFRL